MHILGAFSRVAPSDPIGVAHQREMNVMRKHIASDFLTVLAVMTRFTDFSPRPSSRGTSESGCPQRCSRVSRAGSDPHRKGTPRGHRQPGRADNLDQDGRGKMCHVYRSDGKNVRVCFSNDGYSGVQIQNEQERLLRGQAVQWAGQGSQSLQLTLRIGKTTWKAGENPRWRQTCSTPGRMRSGCIPTGMTAGASKWMRNGIARADRRRVMR